MTTTTRPIFERQERQFYSKDNNFGGSFTNGITGVNGFHKTEEFDSKSLHFTLNDLSTLSQTIKRNRPSNSSLIPQIAFIVDGRSDISNSMGDLQSYLGFRHSLPITIDLRGTSDQNSQFTDVLIRSLIETYPKLLIQIKLDNSSDNPYNGLYFTATSNTPTAKKTLEFLISKCNISEKQANLSVWKVVTKGLKDYSNRDIYLSHDDQNISLKDVFEYIQSEFSGESTHHSSLSLSAEGKKFNPQSSWPEKLPSWSLVDKKDYSSQLSVTTFAKDNQTYEITYIQKIFVQVSIEQRKMIIISLKQNVIDSDASDICSTQEIDGSFHLHTIICEHLKIHLIDEVINGPESDDPVNKGLTFFVESEELKNCNSKIWETAFVMKYLEKVLDEYKSEWESAHERADEWISGQVDEQLKELLYFSCEEYLIQKGIKVHNEQRKKIFKFKVDSDTSETIVMELRGAFYSMKNNEKELFDEIIESLSANGNFECNELVFGSFKIHTENIDLLKNYADKLRLRRFDKKVWITSLIVVYFQEILKDDLDEQSEWRSTYDNAKIWVNQQVHNDEFEEEIYDACSKYLMKEGYNYLTNNHF